MKVYKKPGAAVRSMAAFGLLNLPLLVTGYVVYHLAGGETAEWWVRGIVAVLISAAEFSIVTTTIGPPLYDWIQGEESVKDGEKPSWEK